MKSQGFYSWHLHCIAVGSCISAVQYGMYGMEGGEEREGPRRRKGENARDSHPQQMIWYVVGHSWMVVDREDRASESHSE